MNVPAILIGSGTALLLVSLIGTTTALVLYFRRDDAKAFGFGFAEYYYGEMRRSHPRVFQASFGGAALGMALCLLAGVFRDG